MKSIARFTAMTVVLLALILSVGCPPNDGSSEFLGARVILSRGELPQAGQENVGQLFYVISEERFYYSDGTAWVVIDLTGPAGAEAVGITWMGALPSAPSNPGLNWAYYDMTEGAAYIWDGDSWELLCRDGSDAQSLNVRGIVAPGSYLALVHNLGRDNLTFTGQFVKEGYIFDHGDYAESFGGGAVVGPRVFETAGTSYASATALQNGNVIIAYRDDGNSGYGTFLIYGPSGGWVVGPTVFESASTYYISAIALRNGNVLIAYSDEGNAYYGTFVIYSPSGSLVAGPTLFESAGTTDISTTTLQNSNALIAYSDVGNGRRGTFVIVDPSGALVVGPIVFEADITYQISPTPLLNGNALIAFRRNVGGYGTFVIYNPSGTLVAGPTVFELALTSFNSAITLQNGNVLIAYQDGGNSSYGTFVIYSQLGSLVAGPAVFESAYTSYISAAALHLQNGNVLIAYQDGGNSSYGTFVVYSQSGSLVAGPTVFESASTAYIAATTLPLGNALIAYQDAGSSNYGTFVISGPELRLQKVDNNQVRLWNYTWGETLELLLSVNQ